MKHPKKVKKLAVMGAVLYNTRKGKCSVFEFVNDTLHQQITRLEKTNPNSFLLRVKKMLLTEPNINPASLKSIQCPVLVMAGKNGLIKPVHTKLIANNIPHSKLVFFKKAGHQAPKSIPKKFNKTVLKFLK